MGARPYRCFLVHTTWTGKVRGEGNELPLARVEILPTPLVKSLDSVSFSIFHAGVVPAGSVRVEEISVRSFDEDVLRGLVIADLPWTESCADPLPVVADVCGTNDGQILQPYSFHWEVVEDGRNNCEPERKRFRLLSNPTLRADQAEWTVMLERTSADDLRSGRSPFAPGSGR